jgi:DNA-binding transcriptional MerR regulator
METSVGALREYEDAGLIYTAGRSAGNYRLFGEEALWCVEVIGVLRALGLTMAEIGELAGHYLQQADEGSGSFWFWPPIAPAIKRIRVIVSTLWEAAWADIELPGR